MFLEVPCLFTLCPPAPAPYMPSPRERYLDALVNLRAAEASYLAFKAVEREEEVLARHLRELQLHQREDQLRLLAQYFSGDADQTCGLYNLGFQAGHDCCRCDGLASSVCPCTYCVEVAPNPRLESWNLLSLDDVNHFPRVKSLLAPTSSFSDHRRARSFRRSRPLAFKHPFHTRRHRPWDNEQLKNIKSYIPLYQALSIPKSQPVETMSNDGLLQGFAKLFDTPVAHGRQTNERKESISRTVPHRAETQCEYDSLKRGGVTHIFPTPSASPAPDAEITPASEGEARLASGDPNETTLFEGELNTPVPTAFTTPPANPSTADPPIEATTPAEISSFDKIRTIETSFNVLKENFTLPVELDFLPSIVATPSALSMSASDSDTESVSATDHLTYSPLNRPVRSYEQALTVLLEQLDGIESRGDDDVRKSRREVVKSVERALEELERDVEGRRRISVSEPLAEKAGKADNEGEDNGAVLGLELDGYENQSEREDDAQKQDRFDDRADVNSGPLSEIIEQNISSPAITTASISDDLSAWIDTSTHGNNPTPAIPHGQLEFSDATPVVEIPPSPAHTIDPVEVTDSIPSPVLIASTTNSFSADAEPGLSTSSPSSVLETASTTPSNANAIIGGHVSTIPVDILTKSAVESSTPVLEASSTASKNTRLTASVQCADVEPEGFVLTFRGADESVSEHPIVRDRDEDWLEVDI